MKRSDHGSALVMAVFVVALLTAIGVALLSLTQSEVRMSVTSLDAKQSFFLAEAAVEDGRLSLFATNGSGPFDDDLEIAAGGNGNPELDAAALRPLYDADGRLTGFDGIGDDVALRDVQPFGEFKGRNGWYAAFLSNDPPELGSTTDLNDRVMITGIGALPGGPIEVVQAIIEQRSLIPPTPPAAITLLGPDPYFRGGSSGAKAYVGDDCDGAGIPGLTVPTVGVIGPGAKPSVTDNLGKTATYHAQKKTGGDTIADVTNPSEPFMGGNTIDPLWTDCVSMLEFAWTIRQYADVVCTTPSCVLPPPAPDRIVFVEGNYDAPDGEGLLVVTDRLQVPGGWEWSGLVLVLGTGEMKRLGGGSGAVLGGVVVANIAGPDRTLFSADDCSVGPDGFDSASFDTQGGGSSTISYCQAALDAVNVSIPYEIVDFRQR